MSASPEVLLLDFFGTLVAYRDGVRNSPCERALTVLAEAGIELTAPAFIEAWDAAFGHLLAATEADHAEFSMADVARRFAAVSGHALDDALLVGLVDAYLEDWTGDVAPIPGVAEALENVDARCVLVSNTHHTPMVNTLLRRFRLDHRFEAVITSVELGWRKPHPRIYRAALDAAGTGPEGALFIGDDPWRDYRAPRALGIEALLVGDRVADDVPEAHRFADVSAALRDGIGT